MKLKNYFLPHPETHKRAHLISSGAFAIYLAFFVVLQMVFGVLGSVKPNVLGIASSISGSELINLTNQERQKVGLDALAEDSRLDQAAKAKGENMFTEQYWAHYSPSGKSPWGFIANSGYKYSYAGENLARNFNSSSEVVVAWMASPTHKENIVNSHYKNIGMAVLEGNLNGQPTILVVQEFGTPIEYVAQVPKTPSIVKIAEAANLTNPSTSPIASITPQIRPQVASENTTRIDPYLSIKYLGIGTLGILLILIIVDMILIKKRGVTRLVSRNMIHIVFIVVVLVILFNLSRGVIG